MSNLTYRQKKVVEVFALNIRNKSPKGWIYGSECPFCKRSDKFGIKLNHDRNRYKNHISFNCFHGSCQEKGSEFKLLKAMKMLHLIKDGEFLGNKNRLEQLKLINEDEEVLELNVPKRHKPFGFRPIVECDYLKERGFESWQYELYNIGQTKLTDKLKNYVLFLIHEGGENRGYVARSTWSHEQIKKYEDSTGKRFLMKYNNEAGVDFGKLVFGLDEITQNTKHVIIVEGITDKANVDRLLKLNTQELVKCVCTFGKKMSEEQIVKLWNKGIDNVTMLYDPDAVDASKKYSYQLEMWFSTVKVGYLHSKDPGELTLPELQTVLNRTQTPSQFDIDKVQKLKLN